MDKDHALKLSGKLAIAANRVINSRVLDLSNNVEKLQNALMEYDNYIFNHKNKRESGNVR